LSAHDDDADDGLNGGVFEALLFVFGLFHRFMTDRNWRNLGEKGDFWRK